MRGDVGLYKRDVIIFFKTHFLHLHLQLYGGVWLFLVFFSIVPLISIRLGFSYCFISLFLLLTCNCLFLLKGQAFKALFIHIMEVNFDGWVEFNRAFEPSILSHYSVSQVDGFFWRSYVHVGRHHRSPDPNISLPGPTESEDQAPNRFHILHIIVV